MSDRVYVTVEERVTTGLLAFTPAVLDGLEVELGAEGGNIKREVASDLFAHGTGRLARSVKSRTKRYRDVAVWTSISAGGTKATRQGHLFERGFEGVEEVREHRRTSRFGTIATVQAYRRTVTYPAHLYMASSLDGRRAAIRARVFAAVGQATAQVGLAS